MASFSEQDDFEKNRWLFPVCLLSGIFFLNFAGRIILTPLLPAIERELRISHSDAGALFLSISLGYFFSLLGSGYVASRITHRQIIILSAFLVGLALIGTSFGTRLWQLHAGLLLLGAAAGIYLPSGIATLTTLLDADRWGRALSIHELAPNLAFFLAPFAAEFLMLVISWRGVLLAFGLGSIMAGLVYFRIGSGGNFPGQQPDLALFRRIAGKRSFWGFMVLFTLGVGSTIGVYTMLPLFLVEDTGMSRYSANLLVGSSRLATLASVFLAGWAADRYGTKRTMGMVLILVGTLTVSLGLLQGRWHLLAIFLQPLAAVCFFPSAFAYMSSAEEAELRNIIISLTVPFAFLFGGGLLPTAIGALGDFGLFRLAFSLTGATIILGGIFALLFLPQKGGLRHNKL